MLTFNYFEILRAKVQAALLRLSFARGIRYECGVTEDGDFKVMFMSKSKEGVTFENTLVLDGSVDIAFLPTTIGHVINKLLIETIKG